MTERLRPVSRSRRAPLGIIRELWHARDLVTQFTKRDLAIRYTQAVMGFAWALLMPMLIVGAGLIFRLVVASLSNAPITGNSVASLAIKSLPWAFFSGALSIATQSIISHANLIGKIYFPREALPLAAVLAQCTDFVLGLVVVLLLFPTLGVSYAIPMLWIAVPIVLLVLFTIGMALILSCANLFFRDVKYIVQVVLSFGVFATPVFFEPQMLGARAGGIMLALPLTPFIQAMNIAGVQHHSLLDRVIADTAKGPVVIWAPWMLLYASLLSLSVLYAGLRIFRRASSRFAEMA